MGENAKMLGIEPKSAMKQVIYSCGCICQFPLLGNYAETREWHIILSCQKHTADNICEFEQKAELDFQRLLGERN